MDINYKICFLSLDQYVKHKIIDVFIEREDGSLGIILRGGAHPDPDMCKPLTVTHVRPDGPADRLVKLVKLQFVIKKK